MELPIRGVIDWGAIEREAERIYRLARCDLASGARPADLVRATLGPASIAVAPAPYLPDGGALVRIGGAWRVYVRKGLPPKEARFTVLHELAHYVLGPGTEAEADALAAALLAPRAAFERAAAESGGSYARLASWFECTQTFAALRYGEVVGTPLVVVAPASVRIRGTSFSWPAEEALRGLTSGQGLPGVRRAKLRDSPGRFALRSA